MAHAILAVLGTSLFTMIELWVLKLARFDVFGRLNRANDSSQSTRFFFEALILVSFVLIQPAILVGVLSLASPDLARTIGTGIQNLVAYGLSFGY